MRITREEMLHEIVLSVSKRSTCTRRSVGAIIVRDGRILSMGYNGAPSGLPHCLDVGCLMNSEPGGGCSRTQHAEANAIAFAARHGIVTSGTHLWTSVSPCLSCAKLIINAGIERVVCIEPYRDDSGLKLLTSAGIQTGMYW